jgi:hypothetical protein
MTFDAERYLERLKPFQRATVDRVFGRFFDAKNPTDRFLVADEVGLGKTMVARGVVAKLIAHYRDVDPQRRIDVVYVCSNQAIAKQNYSKIAIVGDQREAVTDRITKLPLHIHALRRRVPEVGMPVNFIPITPTTSLDLRSNRGRVDERALLHVLLESEYGTRYMKRRGSDHLLRFDVVEDRWFWRLDDVRHMTINHDLRRRFLRDARKSGLLSRFEEGVELFASRHSRADPELTWTRSKLVGDLRRTLAKSCIDALEPDLIILDEFQRFSRLLDPEDKLSELAQLLFESAEAKTLLLSATPYKMLTRAADIGEDHHAEFLKTTSFLLCHREREVAAVAEALRKYRAALRNLDTDGTEPTRQARDDVARRLRSVMCRTERLAATANRSGMLDPKPIDALAPRLTESDLWQFSELDRIAEQLKHHDIMEYWKSTPFPLNFMDDYKLAQSFEESTRLGGSTLVKHRLDIDAIRSMRSLDLGNARLRGLVEALDSEQAWRLLWLPPSMPYYAPGRPFDRATLTTKRLVFSAWTVVPKAIAALVSYECERKVFTSIPDGQRPDVQPLQLRPDGPMTELVLSLPSIVLADLGDPKEIAAKSRGADAPVDRRRLLREVEARVRKALAMLPDGTSGRDARWYAAAPLLLDPPELVHGWLSKATDPTEPDSLIGHRRRLLDLVADPAQLGRRPRDLERVLARLAIAGPGVAALRALRRCNQSADPVELTRHALTLGLAFRRLFNLPEATAIVRALSKTRSADDVHWKAALDYCVNGNLQSVLDEYVHVLTDWVEDPPADKGGKARAVTDTAVEALGVHSADLSVRTLDASAKRGERLTMRSRFALRFGDSRSEVEQSLQRVDTVRKAFNSPFWPFVLATTSIGQEGLDFHLYSHKVVHWNLPSNPVDLEQREGRVHRYKGHAVRRNLVAHYRTHGLRADDDPWAAMFALAPPDHQGLQPYWILEGGSRIERHSLTTPFSRDSHRLDELVRLLGIYRLAFGQPRQDELLAALRRLSLTQDEVQDLLIDLRPEA